MSSFYRTLGTLLEAWASHFSICQPAVSKVPDCAVTAVCTCEIIDLKNQPATRPIALLCVIVLRRYVRVPLEKRHAGSPLRSTTVCAVSGGKWRI